MLRSLQIENYALIRSLQIDFAQGMTVITGETGAGKSIIMGAMSLILGNRADTSVLLDAHKKCFVEAAFDISGLELAGFFATNDLDYQDITIIRREISESGKSRAFLNDTPVTLSTLKEFTSKLIDIHSQHQNLLFQDADFRVNVIDEFAGIRSQVAEYRQRYAELLRNEKALAELQIQRQAVLDKKDYLEFVYNELIQAHLAEDEQQNLEQEIEFLSHTEAIKANLFQSQQILSEKESSVMDELREVKGLCAAISSYHIDLEGIANRLESAFIDLKDILSEINSVNDKIDFDPEILALKQERLDLLYGLQQKHHVSSMEELMGKMKTIGEELGNLVADESKIEKMTVQCADQRTQLQHFAAEISCSRSAVISTFENQIVQKIKQLGIPYAQFQVKLNPSDNLHKNGIDQIQFLFSANQGFALAEIEKVASGGEMSRLMLAVKSTISDRAVLPTIVFDEIDVGISGEVAGKVAAMMQTMASNRQLLVITHLPQIAAKGGSHYQVYKQIEEGQSRTNIRLLEGSERITEIAKMMSGEHCSEAALSAAQELIES